MADRRSKSKSRESGRTPCEREPQSYEDWLDFESYDPREEWWKKQPDESWKAWKQQIPAVDVDEDSGWQTWYNRQGKAWGAGTISSKRRKAREAKFGSLAKGSGIDSQWPQQPQQPEPALAKGSDGGKGKGSNKSQSSSSNPPLQKGSGSSREAQFGSLAKGSSQSSSSQPLQKGNTRWSGRGTPAQAATGQIGTTPPVPSPTPEGPKESSDPCPKGASASTSTAKARSKSLAKEPLPKGVLATVDLEPEEDDTDQFLRPKAKPKTKWHFSNVHHRSSNAAAPPPLKKGGLPVQVPWEGLAKLKVRSSNY